jgi:hypothetical protein
LFFQTCLSLLRQPDKGLIFKEAGIMNKTVKVFLFSCGGLLLTVVIGLGALYLLFQATLGQTFDEQAEEARQFGKTTDAQGCINEGLRRARLLEAKDFSIKDLPGSTWMVNCLDTSQPTEGFCDKVPTMSEEFGNALKEKAYEEQACKQIGFGQKHPHCKMVFSGKQQHCWSK